MNACHLAFAAVLATASLLHAQEPVQRTFRRSPVAENADMTQNQRLSRNYMVSIAGSLGKSEPMNVILRGSSKRFYATLENPTRTMEIFLDEDGDNVTVFYSLAARIAVKVGDNATSYQDASTSGSFLATLGEAFPVLEVGDSRLTIQVDPMPAKK